MTEENPIRNDLMRKAQWTAFLSGKKRTVLELFFCAVTGWMLTAVFEGLSFYFLAYIGLLPLFLAVYSRSMKRAFCYGFVWGYFWHLGSFFWLREIFIAIPFAMAPVLGVFNGIFACFIPFFRKYLLQDPSLLFCDREKRNLSESFSSFREILFALAAASLWTVLEYIRSNIFTGLPWNLLGASQWKILTLIQIADITGVYGLSFILVLFNAVLFTFLLTVFSSLIPESSPLRDAFVLPGKKKKLPEEKRGFLSYGKTYKRPLALMFALAVIAMASSYSFVRLRSFRKTETNSITLYAGAVQPNLSQRRHGGNHSTREALAVCTALSEELFLPGKQKPHVVIWPETAVPTPFNASLENSVLLRQELYRMISAYDTPFLFGSIRLDRSPADKNELLMFNSAILWEKGNTVTSFDKVHIVPFGEFVPWSDTFPVLSRIVGMGRNLSRGTRFNPLTLMPGVRAGISICYEDIFSYVSRNHVLNGANMLLTITNDAWYPTSYEPAQHCANSVFRAVECRLPFLRVGNMDFSCVVSPAGKIAAALATDEKGRPDPSFRSRRSGILPVEVPVEYTPTFYVKYGDVFCGLCTALLSFLFVAALVNCRKFKSGLLSAAAGTESSDGKK